jgi:hypothetical protein
MMKLVALAFLAGSASAFVPAQSSSRAATSLNAERSQSLPFMKRPELVSRADRESAWMESLCCSRRASYLVSERDNRGQDNGSGRPSRQADRVGGLQRLLQPNRRRKKAARELSCPLRSARQRLSVSTGDRQLALLVQQVDRLMVSCFCCIDSSCGLCIMSSHLCLVALFLVVAMAHCCTLAVTLAIIITCRLVRLLSCRSTLHPCALALCHCWDRLATPLICTMHRL